MDILNKKSTGILLHITSLPSGYGIGDLGPAAYKFADFLWSCKQGYWQVLPLNPTTLEDGNSPYSSSSVFAGNELLISPELLVEQNFLEKEEVRATQDFKKSRINYSSSLMIQIAILAMRKSYSGNGYTPMLMPTQRFTLRH